MNDVQKCILDIYKEIKKVCDKNHITYYGSSGTCLGAIRHKGFIPWDDDMDIDIPIEEFDRFLEVAKKELPEYLEIYSPFERSHFPHLMVKIIDKRTTFIEKAFLKYEDSWSGVWIDIIPICGVPKNILARKLFYARIWKSMYLDLYYREDYLGSHFVFLQKMIKNFILKNRDTNFYMRKQLELVKKHSFKKASYVMDVGFFHFENWTSKKCWFDKRKEVEFEDTTIFVPSETDAYLTKQFGNYMEIPKKEDRIIHHGFIDLNRSYKYYVKNPEIIREYFKNN
ncbi:MAG: LicD family protein [Eubacteriales bacterium]|nr:LicD family protein [Eubacteriales bacterium]MDY3332945.1 LicD family protein [Gallibacter sp.]